MNKDIVVVGGQNAAIQGLHPSVANAESDHQHSESFAAGTESTVRIKLLTSSTRHVLSPRCDSFFPSALVVDAAWARTYEGRTDHPVEQAELAEVATNGLVVRVGKNIGPENAWGEFICLAKFDSAAIARFWAMYLDQLAQGDDAPFIHAPTLRKAYLTDLLNHAI